MMESAGTPDDVPALTAPLVTLPGAPLADGTLRVRAAVAAPRSRTLVAATAGNEIVAGEHRVSVPALVRALAAARYVSVRDSGLPTHCALVAVLLEGAGVALFALPELTPVGDAALADAIADASRGARLLAADALGGEPIGEAFRIAIATGNQVSLLCVNVPAGTVETLATASMPESVIALAFADMTVVATTTRSHCMLRIARNSSMALAATVARKEPANRARRGSAGGDAGAAVMSFFGGLFTRRDSSARFNNRLAFPLPENRWVLSVDQEWVTYSSFGMKLEDMENVFKSRMAIDIPESEVNAALSVVGSPSRRGRGSPPPSIAPHSRKLSRSMSVSSMASVTSVATTFTAMTIVDEASAARAEKPAAVAAFSSPFVLCITEKCELLAFAANGSIPGAIATLDLVEEGKQPEPGAGIVPCVDGRCIAILYWPTGRVVEIHLSNDLDSLIEEREAKGELRSALSLVPIDQVDRTIMLRRKLAVEARETDWHDACIHHMQHVVNLCVARDGVGQLDLIMEALELRGPRGSSWESDAITATLWADFLFRLRRRIMQASPADVDIIETLCRADASCTRVKALLLVKHEVSMEAGEAAITAGDCELNEEDRIEALVALYSSLGEHDKALVLLENSGINRAFQTVCSFLTKSMRLAEKPDVFFKHLKWVATESKVSKSRETDFMNILDIIISTVKESDEPAAERMLQGMMPIIVEYTPHMVDPVIDRMTPLKSVPIAPESDEKGKEDKEVKTEVPKEAEKTILSEEKKDDKAKQQSEDSKPTEKDKGKDGSQEKNGDKADVKKGPVQVQLAVGKNEGAIDQQSIVESEVTEDAAISTDLLAVALLAGMTKADILEERVQFEKLRDLFRVRVLHKDDADYDPDKLVKALQAAQTQSLSLHEELAFLLGRQGLHEAAAMELAAETSMSATEATRRLEKLLPSSDRSSAAQALVAAYLHVSGDGRPSRVQCAAELVRREGGTVDVEKVLREISSTDRGKRLSLAEMAPFLQAALITGNERVRLAEVLRALRTSEVRRVRDEVLMRRRRCVMIGHERACSICTRRIGDSVFAAYPDGSVTHLVCHMSSKKT